MQYNEKRERRIGVAADIGSTTIAAACFDLETREELAAFSYTNPQTAYGADVVTRIQKCTEKEDMLFMMGNLVRKSMQEQLKVHLNGQFHRICKIVCSGNTAMLHILRGISVEGLAAAPFFPAALDFAEELMPAGETVLPGSDLSAGEDGEGVLLVYPPGLSAFVGADILSGAEFLHMGKQAEYDLLVDLGTNGELILLNNQCGYAASTACGSVFDSAVAGAAYGSECIKAVANCVKRGLIDKTGRIAKPYFETGICIDRDFRIRQEHVRNFQLAKGAVFAGISCLMERAGIAADAISTVYLSGGLGFYMDVRDAFTVKMLPREFRGKIRICGNTSLEGAKRLLLAESEQRDAILREYEQIRKRTKSFELANFERFKENFIYAVNF